MKSDRSCDMAANVAIIGAGLAGRLLAWRLSLDSNIQNITVYDAGELNESSKAAAFTAAAMLSPLSELVSSEKHIFDLGKRSMSLWQEWLDELNLSHCFHQQGSLVIAHSGDRNGLVQFERDLRQKLKDTADSELHTLNSQQQLNELEPHLNSDFNRGIFLPEEAHLDHFEILETLVEHAKDNGVTFLENTVVEKQGEQFFARHKSQTDDKLTSIDAKTIIDCRGMGSQKDLKQLRGVRGEVIRFESTDVVLNRPIRLMHPRYKLYLVPKPNHQFILGATELESEDRSNISLRSSMELMSALYAISPAFSEARILKTDSNLRPAFPDNLPKISQSSSENTQHISINGLYRHGYLIGPAVVNDVEKLLAL